MGFETGANQERVNAIETLKKRAMTDIGDYYLGGMPEPGQIGDGFKDAQPNTWNVHGGIIILVDGAHKIHALPETNEYLTTLQNDPKVSQDSGMGVPRLGDASVWDKDPEKGLEHGGFNAWKRLWDEHYGAREMDAKAREEAGAAERNMDSDGSQAPEDLEAMYKV